MSTKKVFLVTGATGKVGGQVARKLLAQGHTVRVFGRDAERLGALVEAGAIPAIGDMQNAPSVLDAFDGVDSALLIGQGSRTARDYRREFALVGEHYAAAAKSKGLKSAVFISTLGAGSDRNRGLVLVHSDIEHSLNGVDGLSLINLRAPMFLENLFYFLHPMRTTNTLTWPVKSDALVDLGSTAEVADVAVDFLTANPAQNKRVVELYGHTAVTLTEVGEMIRNVLGRPFNVRPSSREEDVEILCGAGFGRDFALLMNDTWESASRGLMRETIHEHIELRGSIEEFIRQALVPAILAPVPSELVAAT